MEYLAGGIGGVVVSGGNVPAFLTKLWTLVEDPETDPLIFWSPSGTSFHVFDQGRFAKEVLPKFFKHNNMASFIRQLNMYGFRKVVHIEQGGLVKPEKDDTEFQHPFFIRGQEHLLENIKRKVTNVSSVRHEEVKISADEVNKILSDVQTMKGKQETIDSRIITLKHENEALWREVASLRQKHVQQQKVVNKLIQFLVSLVQTNRLIGVKRKIPLMLNDSISTHSMPKYSRTFSLETPASLLSPDSPMNSGPIISDITEIAASTPDDEVTDWTDLGESQSAYIKEEPSSPEVEVSPVLECEQDSLATNVDTPLSPTAFINSILQDNETQPTQVISTTTNTTQTDSPIIVLSPTSSGPPPSPITVQTSAPVNNLNSAAPPSPATTQKKCQAVVCLDRFHPPSSAGGLPPDAWRIVSKQADKSDLLDHVDSIDNGLENLQTILNSQTFTFDPSPLMDFFSSTGPAPDFDIDSLDTLLAEEAPRESEGNTGKQLVHYSATPVQITEPDNFEESGADRPFLLELEEEPLFSSDTPTDNPADVLLSHTQLDSGL